MLVCLKRILSHDSGPFWQFVKYGVIGVLSTIVHLFVFYVLAATILPCLTPNDAAVRFCHLPSVTFTGAESWYAARWFLSALATVIGFSIANVFCWLMNRFFVFRPGKFRWLAEFAMFYAVAASATLLALGAQTALIVLFDVTTTIAAFSEVLISFFVNFFVRKFFIFKG